MFGFGRDSWNSYGSSSPTSSCSTESRPKRGKRANQGGVAALVPASRNHRAKKKIEQSSSWDNSYEDESYESEEYLGTSDDENFPLPRVVGRREAISRRPLPAPDRLPMPFTSGLLPESRGIDDEVYDPSQSSRPASRDIDDEASIEEYNPFKSLDRAGKRTKSAWVFFVQVHWRDSSVRFMNFSSKMTALSRMYRALGASQRRVFEDAALEARLNEDESVDTHSTTKKAPVALSGYPPESFPFGTKKKLPVALDSEKKLGSLSKPQVKRALIIGIKYEGSDGELRNTLHDAQDVASTFTKMKFIVTCVAKKQMKAIELNDTLENFYSSINKGDIVVFYFAGHGVMYENKNWLFAEVPEKLSNAQFSGVDAQDVLGKLESTGSASCLCIMDCCREMRARSRSIGSPAFFKENISVVPRGVYLMHACGPGECAADGQDRNGLFTKHLLQHIAGSERLEDICMKVAQGVYAESKQRQRPYATASLFAPIYLAA